MPDPRDPPAEVAQIRAEIRKFLATTDEQSRRIGGCKCAVYAFFDYDGEPIYVGQTVEQVSTRVGRHLTGRRSDAVAKFVLDPFEVLDIEVWPLFELDGESSAVRKEAADRLEYAVFEKCLAESQFGAVLNEGGIKAADPIDLPQSYRGRIIPEGLMAERQHPDVRIARRALTIASLARLISERSVGKELRTTLLVQSQRLEELARRRLEEFAGEEETGDEIDDTD
jgi:hypothetical protein